MKVSVIIPIYNAEDFLQDALSDIMHQSLEDIEIICVDDGSTDSSREIVRSCMEEDSRIQLYCQENLYCGVARNTGMAHAAGEYLCFWDADDRFQPDALELMYQKAKEMEADICVCGVDEFDSGTGNVITRFAYLNVKAAGTKQPFNRYDIPEQIFNFTTNHVWNKMLLRSFVEKHHLTFGTGDYSEETMFIQPALYYADRICYVNKPLVRYRIFNAASTVSNTSVRQTKYYKDLCSFYRFMKATGEFDIFEVSILKKCLGSFLADLEANGSYEQFCVEYQDLKTETFQDLGLTEKDEEFFGSKINYQKMQRILQMEPGDYILQNLADVKRSMHLQLQKERSDKEKKFAALEKTYSEQNAALSKSLQEKTEELEHLLKELKASEEKMKELETSYACRFGKILMLGPEKLKRLLCSLRK